MSQLRVRRVGIEIQKVLAELIEREIKDARIKDAFVTVTQVDVTPDFMYAKVYVSVLLGDKAEAAMEGLRSSAGFLRKEVGKRVKLRLTPQLQFVLDTSLEYAIGISKVIDRVILEDEEKQK